MHFWRYIERIDFMGFLNGKVIYVIATGCRRSRELPIFINGLEKNGAKVYLFATEACQKLIDFNDDDFKNINLRLSNNLDKRMEIEKEDLILVAPCSLNTLNKISNGIADSYPLTLVHTAIGRNTKVIICASMNIDMWNNYTVKKSIETISNMKNVTLVWPDITYDDNGNEVSSTMVSWSKVEDTIMSNLHILPFNSICESETNNYNINKNKFYNELYLSGKACNEISICPNSAGCIAMRVNDGILISSTGSSLGNLSLEDMVLIKKMENDIIYYEGYKKPSSESVIAYHLLKDKPIGTVLLHCHCQKITYSFKNKSFTTKEYFMSKNIEQIKEVESIVEKNGFVNLYLHGQIFVDSSFEIIIGKIVKMYCEL